MEPSAIFGVVLIAYSIILHEIAHGFAAYCFGDRTAKDQGRLSLNPIAHVDPFGTVLFPLFQVLVLDKFLIGWAKPVPVCPANYKHRVVGDLVVSLAGIATNLGIALLCAVCSGLVSPDGPLDKTLIWVLVANVALACFNLLPIPPLDGSHVVKYLLPEMLRRPYQQLGFYGILILLVLSRQGAIERVLWVPVFALLKQLMLVRDAVRGLLW